ncbi:phage adaptor protein [Vibrio sp. ER1A]|uniref:phage adaptor protein n=1 Tax=Vibrio sp. ER1A TaxID=1517681 RepID=UPI0004DD424F|nr:DUF6682 family protein [Vibrio sp. ER1A]KFA99477.1 hypothetical protein HW45_03715 [Vibrio sp. ER1A]
MANSTMQSLIKTASELAVDKDFDRWTIEDHWIPTLNDAIKAVIIARPDSYVVDSVFACKAGTKQTLDEDVVLLFNVVRNVGGKAVGGLQDMKFLDDYRPEWRESTGKTATDTYMYDETTPKTFYIYPGVVDGHQLEIQAASIPALLDKTKYDANEKIALSPIWDNPVIEFMIYRTFSQDAEFAANGQRAALALQAFNSLLGIKTQGDAMFATSQQPEQQQPK